jgi:hypothetical protein
LRIRLALPGDAGLLGAFRFAEMHVAVKEERPLRKR